MTQIQRLSLIALFTLLFIVLLIIGSVLIVRGQTVIAVLVFLLAFVSVGGQMASLAAWIKHRSRP